MKPTIFLQILAEHAAVVDTLAGLNEDVCHLAASAVACLRNGGKIMFCGNGGSAADSQHLAAELTGRFVNDRRPLAALALSTDSSALTCIANDYSFSEVFARQVVALGKPGDVLIAISTSGNSPNVIRAVEEAERLGIYTVGLLGRDGGSLRKLCRLSVIVPSDVTARIQECHILLGHSLCEIVEREMGYSR